MATATDAKKIIRKINNRLLVGGQDRSHLQAKNKIKAYWVAIDRLCVRLPLMSVLKYGLCQEPQRTILMVRWFITATSQLHLLLDHFPLPT